MVVVIICIKTSELAAVPVARGVLPAAVEPLRLGSARSAPTGAAHGAAAPLLAPRAFKPPGLFPQPTPLSLPPPPPTTTTTTVSSYTRQVAPAALTAPSPSKDPPPLHPPQPPPPPRSVVRSDAASRRQSSSNYRCKSELLFQVRVYLYPS